MQSIDGWILLKLIHFGYEHKLFEVIAPVAFKHNRISSFFAYHRVNSCDSNYRIYKLGRNCKQDILYQFQDSHLDNRIKKSNTNY